MLTLIIHSFVAVSGTFAVLSIARDWRAGLRHRAAIRRQLAALSRKES